MLLFYRYALSTYFIEGLVQYIPTGSSNITPTATSGAAITTAKNRKQVNNNKLKDKGGLGDAENLMVYRVPASQVQRILFFPILDSMVRLEIFFIFLLLSAAASGSLSLSIYLANQDFKRSSY
jgi:hypothetical protein